MQYNFYVFTLRQNTYLKDYPVFLLLITQLRLSLQMHNLDVGLRASSPKIVLGDCHFDGANASHPRRNI